MRLKLQSYIGHSGCSSVSSSSVKLAWRGLNLGGWVAWSLVAWWLYGWVAWSLVVQWPNGWVAWSLMVQWPDSWLVWLLGGLASWFPLFAR